MKSLYTTACLVGVLGSCLLLPASQAQIDIYVVGKIKTFWQDSDGQANLPPSWRLESHLDAGPNDITEVSLSAAGNTVTMDSYFEGGSWFEYSDYFADQAGLDAAWPNGSFQFNYSGGTLGAGSLDMDLTGDSYPMIPNVGLTGSSWSSLQGMEVTQDLTLTWNQASWTGAGPQMIFMNFYDRNSSQEFEFELNYSDTSLLIPANTLAPSSTYEGELLFAQIVQSYDEGAGLTLYATMVEFEFATIPEPRTYAAIVGLIVLAGMVVVRRPWHTARQ